MVINKYQQFFHSDEKKVKVSHIILPTDRTN